MRYGGKQYRLQDDVRVWKLAREPACEGIADFKVELEALPPGDRFRRRILALHRVGDPGGQLRAGVGDRRALRLLAVLRLGFAAIALPAEYHADLDAHPVPLKSGRNQEYQEDYDKGDGDPNRLLHAKKFPIRRNLA